MYAFQIQSTTYCKLTTHRPAPDTHIRTTYCASTYYLARNEAAIAKSGFLLCWPIQPGDDVDGGSSNGDNDINTM